MARFASNLFQIRNKAEEVEFNGSPSSLSSTNTQDAIDEVVADYTGLISSITTGGIGAAASDHNHNGVYLPVGGTAYDAQRLGSQSASYYQPAATAVEVSDIVDSLTSTNQNAPLSANQGRLINGFFNFYVSKAEVVDGLNSTLTNIPLSANQGRVLNSTVGGKLSKSSNLSDVASAATSRTNLGVLSSSEVSTAITANTTGKLNKASNLSDVTSASTARTNLDVYSKGEVTSIANTKMASFNIETTGTSGVGTITDGAVLRVNGGNGVGVTRSGGVFSVVGNNATTSAKGVVQLSNSTTGTSQTLAATANAVRLAMNAANAKGDAPIGSTGASGYWKCNETGLMLQWGRSGLMLDNGSAQSVALPTSFPNICVGVTLTPTAYIFGQWAVSLKTKTSFNIFHDDGNGGSSAYYDYLAWGY